MAGSMCSVSLSLGESTVELLNERQEVIIEKVVRNKRKCITIVKGLELFGIKLSDASKKLGKKFATGASVVKSFLKTIDCYIAYIQVPGRSIFFIEDGKKVQAG
ncbi:hypothetical protein YC2023_021127 [Brassica napus]